MKAHTARTSSAKLAAVLILGAASLLFTGCFYMPGVNGRPAKAGISVNRSLLPANVSSVALIVGGPGMETIATQYPVGTTSATLSVPSGVARTFTLLANTASVTFRDDVTVDLAPDETAVIDLKPTLSASQIIVPDYGNARLVQISDMRGTGLSTLSDILTFDVDFDDQGRIYVAASGGIIQMDDISSGAVPLTITPTGVQSIAMDRAHGLLYYVGYNVNGEHTLWRIAPDKGNETQIDLSAMGSFTAQGIAVDSDGFVYMATTLPSVAILKIDPNPASAPTIVKSYSSTLNYPYDVLVNGDYIYVSDFGARQIVRLSRNLDFVDSFSGPATDRFLGPERFVAILNKPITVIDEAFYYEGNRLVSFGDMTGAGWTTYEPQNAGLDEFEFFYSNSGG